MPIAAEEIAIPVTKAFPQKSRTIKGIMGNMKLKPSISRNVDMRSVMTRAFIDETEMSVFCRSFLAI